MKHYFVVNPRSFEGQGTLEKFFAEVEGCLEDGTYQIHMSQRPREAISAIWSYRHSIPRAEILRVYAVGGDGILFDCLNGVMGIWNAELAAVPYGKQNDFVRSFGEGKQHIFRDIDSQVKAAARPVDVVRCGNNYCLTSAIVGIEAAANFAYIRLGRFAFLRQPRLGWLLNLLYTFGAFRNIFNRHIVNQSYRLIVDGVDESGRYMLLNAANAPCYGGDKCAVPTAMPDDGWIDLMTGTSTNRLRLLRMVVPYTQGQYKKFPGSLKCRRVKKLELSSDAPLTIDLDGEVFYDTHLTVEIVPNSLKFVVPYDLPFVSRAEK